MKNKKRYISISTMIETPKLDKMVVASDEEPQT